MGSRLGSLEQGGRYGWGRTGLEERGRLASGGLGGEHSHAGFSSLVLAFP